MAGVDNQFTPFLTNNQQDLLRAALVSNTPNPRRASQSSTQKSSTQAGTMLQDQSIMGDAMFVSPQGLTKTETVEPLDLDATPLVDYLDGDTSLDMDNTEFDNEDMIGDLPGEASTFNGAEKRKNSDVDGADEDGNGVAKRKEGDDKQAKKPGRKPLTSEPTTKRKAQNRAAQRAFRERKEQHLKDLETKVLELTKTTDDEKRENGLLKAQIERLTTELNDYRKRLSSDASRTRSPSALASDARPNNAQSSANNFAFDFPSFGDLPGSLLFGSKPSTLDSTNGATSTASPPTTLRQDSSRSNGSPGANMNNGQKNSRSGSQTANVNGTTGTRTTHRQSSASSQPIANVESFAGLFSPSILNAAGYGTEDNDYGFPKASASPASANPAQQSDKASNSYSNISRAFGGSASSNTESPSQSSLSQFASGTSCNTSPEPSHPSPPKDVSNLNNSNLNFSDLSNNNALSAPSTNNFDWLATQNGGQFDPVLFGDYRESQTNIVGDGDFNNGFFNDAFPFDLNSPLNFDLSSPKPQATTPAPSQQAQPQQQKATPAAAPPSAACLANAEKLREGLEDDRPVSSLDTSMLNCNSIWNQLQNNKDFQDGKFDLDGLCSELRSKAKCSEAGVVVPASEVDRAFKRLQNGQKVPGLVWPTDMVNDAFSKFGSTGMNWGGMGL